MNYDNFPTREDIRLRNPKELAIALLALAGSICCILPTLAGVVAAIPKGITCRNGDAEVDMGIFGKEILRIDSNGSMLSYPTPGLQIDFGSYSLSFLYDIYAGGSLTPGVAIDGPNLYWTHLFYEMHISYPGEAEKCFGESD